MQEIKIEPRDLPDRYFWLGLFGIFTIVVILIPGLIGFEPGKNGSIPTICKIYGWIVLITFWGWAMYFTLAQNEKIINWIPFGRVWSVLLYVLFLIFITALFFNPVSIDVAYHALLAL